MPKFTDRERMKFAARIIHIVREQIMNNNGVYKGSMSPNLQSAIDVLFIDEYFLPVNLDDDLKRYEKSLEITSVPISDISSDGKLLGTRTLK